MRVSRLAPAALIAALSLAGGDAAAVAIDSGPFTYGGHRYYRLTSDTWTSSESFAAGTLGGHLATVDDAAENAWIYGTFDRPRMWIGLNDAGSEGTWSWVNGGTAAYRNWASGEPNGGAAENYAQIYGSATGAPQKWNDLADGGGGAYGIVEVASAARTVHLDGGSGTLNGVTIQFGDAWPGGSATLDRTTAGPEGLDLSGYAYLASFWNVATTIEFNAGPGYEISIRYDETTIPGGLTESGLRLYHIGAGGVIQDWTTSVDPATNVITAHGASFSPFFVGAEVVVPEPAALGLLLLAAGAALRPCGARRRP